MNLKMHPSILIGPDNYFDYLNPSENAYNIEVIAKALSKICRFGGHCNQFYSVAQHSVHVSQLLPPQYALAGLLHDAAEAFMGDIPSPLKQLLPDYKEIYDAIEHDLLQRYGITEIPPCVKHADLVMLATEERDLMPEHDDDWPIIDGIDASPTAITPWSPSEAYSQFLVQYVQAKIAVKNGDGQ